MTGVTTLKLVDDIVPPDPYTHSWQLCWSAYRVSRRAILTAQNMYIDECSELEWAFDDEALATLTPPQRIETSDRYHRLRMLMKVNRIRMMALRTWLYYARVIHGRADRAKWTDYKRTVDMRSMLVAD